MTAIRTRRLWIVCVTLVVAFVVIYGLAATVIEMGFVQNNPNPNSDKQFDEFDNPYNDIIDWTIPDVEKWYRGLGSDGDNILPSIFEKNHDIPRDSSCIDEWFTDLELVAQETNPAYIELVLDNMGLRESVQVRKHLGQYLESPQSLESLYNTSSACLRDMIGLPELACIMRISSPWDLSLTDQKIYILYAIHIGVVLEVLTGVLPTDLSALHEVSEIMENSQRLAKARFASGIYSASMQEFHNSKYNGVAYGLGTLAQHMASKENFDLDQSMFQTNILEAVKIDSINQFNANARVGLAVATRSDFGSVVDDHEYRWRLRKELIDAYMTWNMAFVVGNLEYASVSKLFIPSTSCVSFTDKGEDWVISRVISLTLGAMIIVDKPNAGPVYIEDEHLNAIIRSFELEVDEATKLSRWSIAQELGESNLATADLTSPSRNAIEEMLFRLCNGACHDKPWRFSDSVPLSHFSDTQFQVYTGFIFWVTVMLAGIGLEIFLWVHYLQEWGDSRELLWKFAQFIFSLLLATALGLAAHQDFLALPILVVGLWKFGFPETIMYTYLGMFGRELPWVKRSSDLLNGVGTVVHHGAVALVVVMALVGVVAPTRHAWNVTLIMIIQHWVVLLKYVNKWAYAAVELALEAWFEWTVISDFYFIRESNWTAALAAGVMLFAHWLYLIAGGLDLVVGDTGEHQFRNVHVRGTSSFQKHSSSFTFESQQTGSTSSGAQASSLYEETQELSATVDGENLD